MPKSPKWFCFFLILTFVTIIAGCKRRPAIADKFYEHYKNHVYKDFDTAAYHKVFKMQLAKMKVKAAFGKEIKQYYKSGGFEPHFTEEFLTNGGLGVLERFVKASPEHGLDTALFKPGKLEADLELFSNNKFKNIADVYPVLARLELETATSLLAYSKVMRYGLVNPQKVFNRYDIVTKQPDSAFVKQVFEVKDMGDWLTKIQPDNKNYLKLQRQLLATHADTTDTVLTKKITTLKLNMERLRWQAPPKDDRFIWVNIPAFKFQWIDSGRVVMEMKVCVGEPKPADYNDQLKKYLISKNIDDRPLNHETTILNSRITTIQLNPTWNIPKSIAQNEIYKAILKSPTYLADNNMKVYLNHKQIPNPDAIKWAKIPRDKIPYTFVQDASDLNALGKFKFIFDNESSIYLHDTPNKLAFTKAYRAVSHGCVRVEDPLKLTNLLIADTNRVDDIRMEVGLEPLHKSNLDKYKKLLLKRAAKGFELQSRYITLKKDIQLFIDYYTCWPDANGKIVFYHDVYRKDDDLYKAIGKFLSK